jgi:acyl-CoA hydrolase
MSRLTHALWRGRADRLCRAQLRCASASAGIVASLPQLRWCSADEAVGLVKSGQSVFVHGAAMTPVELVSALARRAGPELKDVSIVSIHTEGKNDLVSEAATVSFRAKAMFCGPNVRQAIADGRADYVPCFLVEIPTFFRQGVVPVDVAMVQLSPPDKHG